MSERRDFSSLYLVALRVLFFLGIVAAVVPNGSVAPTYLYSLCAYFGALLAFTMFMPIKRKAIRTLVLALMALIALGTSYVLFQSLSLEDWPLANPAWQRLAQSGIATGGAISIAPAASLAAIPSLVLPFVVILTGLVLHQDEQSTRALWVKLGLFAGALAILAIVRHQLFPDMALFGARSLDGASLTGNFVNRNVAAAFYCLGALAALSICLIQATQARWTSARQGLLIAGGLSLAACILALFLTQSRAGLALGFSTVVLATLISLPKLLPKTASRRGAVVLFLLAIGAVVLLLGGRALLRFDSEGLDAARWCVNQATLNAIADYRLFGMGLGTFEEAFPIYRTVECGISGQWLRAHNSWLEAYLGLGLPFALMAIAAIGLLTKSLLHGWKARRRMRFLITITALASIYIFAHSLVDFPLQVPGIAVFFAAIVVAGVSSAYARSPSA